MTYLFLTMAIVVLLGVYYYFFHLAPRLDPANRASEFLQQNRFRDAIVEYKKILEDNPFDFVTNYRIATVYLKMNERDQAAQHFEKVLDVNKFNYEVEKVNVQRQLAHIYLFRDDYKAAFQMFAEVLRMFPADEDALFHCAFMALGQEEFEIAQRYFERLVKTRERDFSVLFAAGICSFQNEKLGEALEFFKQAVQVSPDSDIGNIAMVFALMKKRDYRAALQYLAKVSSASKDPQITFLAKRLEGFLDLHIKKNVEAVKVFEEALDFSRSNGLEDEEQMILYDLGFACLRAEQTSKAYARWNELYDLRRNYKDVQNLIMNLRREMDHEDKKNPFEQSVTEKTDEWLHTPYPQGFLWGICGLKSDTKFDVKSLVVTTRISGERSDGGIAETTDSGGGALVDQFTNLDNDNFRIIANRVVGKLGYKVDQIMTTYREPDGVDFWAIDIKSQETVYVWVRRWKKTKVGEIPLRNFAQAINDLKAKAGLFVTTTELTEGAENSLQQLNKVRVVGPDELDQYLKGLL